MVYRECGPNLATITDILLVSGVGMGGGGGGGSSGGWSPPPPPLISGGAPNFFSCTKRFIACFMLEIKFPSP